MARPASHGTEPVLSRTELTSAWQGIRVIPGRAARLLLALWRHERTRVAIGFAVVAVCALLLYVLGAGVTEIRELVLTLAFAALVVAVSADHRTLAAVIVALLGLSLIGTLAGPRWSPVAASDTMRPSTSDTRIGGTVRTHPVGTYEVTSQQVSMTDPEGHKVTGLLRRPKGVATPATGVVFLHGAGTHTLWGFEEQAESLASAGAVTLVPDKPTTGYTLTQRDYVAMADDYAAWVDYLRHTNGVEESRVGIYAESEGAYPGMVIAGRDRNLAFLVLASAPVVPMRDLATFAAGSYLHNVGVPRPLMNAVARLVGARTLPGNSFEYADFDATTYARHMTAPVLMLYGTADSSMPLVQGPQTVRDAMAQAHNSALTVRYYRNANHGLKLGNSTDGPLAPGVARDLSRWVTGQPATAHASPSVAGATPVQDFLARSPGPTRWYASGDLMLGLLLAAVLLVVVSALGWGIGQLPRLTGRLGLHLPDPIGRWSVAMALGAVGSWVLYLAYLAMVARLALSYSSNRWISYGGWVVAQVVALMTLVIMVKLATRIWVMRSHVRHGRDVGGRWLTIPSASVLLCVFTGSLMLLMGLAYWGLFPMLF